VTETATTAPPNNTPSAASQQPSGGLLTRRQVKAAEAAGAAIIADCNAQYAGTETYAQGSAAVNATFVLQAAYEREANTPYPNFIKRGAKPETIGGVVLRAAFAGCPDGVEQDQLKADLGVQ